mmetsp:Transcript_42185/g.89858  ORF Transcript_42185/g.89858 Transcript_42185/m.89858 type:complete len:206 (-) Transcript_42185:939-1556(-)
MGSGHGRGARYHALEPLHVLPLHRTVHEVMVIGQESDHGEDISDELRFHALVEGGGGGKRGEDVYLQEPWLQLVVEHDVEAVNLEASLIGTKLLYRCGAHDGEVRSLVAKVHDSGLCGKEGLYDDILDPPHRVVVVPTKTLEVFPELRQGPLGRLLLTSHIPAVIGAFRILAFAVACDGIACCGGAALPIALFAVFTLWRAATFA